MHNCLSCRFSSDFQKPVSCTTAAKLHLGFKCENPVKTPYYSDAYGRCTDTNWLWYQMDSSIVWIDGGNPIPVFGCENFELDESCNVECAEIKG